VGTGAAAGAGRREMKGGIGIDQEARDMEMKVNREAAR